MSVMDGEATRLSWVSDDAWTKLRNAFVSLIFLTSFYVKIEPAVCDLMFFVAVAMFYRSGLHFSPVIMPLVALLTLYNVGGILSYMQVMDDFEFDSYKFVFITFYMSVMGVFLAAYVAAAPAEHYLLIMRAYWTGATIAAILGLIGYFHFTPISVYFTLFDRAIGGFKDPNVFSTYLILPAVSFLQALALGTVKRSPFNFLRIGIILMGLFLAFSRGAWINVTLSTLLMISLTFLLAPTIRARTNITFSAVFAVGAVIIMIAILMSIPSIRFLLLDRLTLLKNYDSGETGRFGNQLNSIPLLLQQPLGFGPYQFSILFRENPHNSFINAFSSFGWLGGVTYMIMVGTNLFVGFRTIFLRTAFQPYAIAVFSCLAAVTFQAVQIDTEHWRHLWWIIGLTWGFFAASYHNEETEDATAAWQPNLKQ
jgi:hypothetical protein